MFSYSPPIGKPIANTQIYILDQYLQPLPIGVIGEMYIGGDGVAREYINRPELTAKKFIPNPFGKGKLYKTGDLARYLADRNIEFLGRIDNQVKIRGFRVELGEIEAHLNQHPDVKETVVIVKDKLQIDKYLVAYFTVNRKQLKVKELRTFLSKKLPNHMIPSAFVTLDQFPLTPNGKIDRKALPEPDFQENKPEEFIAPRNEIEMEIAQIWQQILKIENISINDNFFELGGHSLLATQVISRIKTNFKVELPLKYLFEFPTISELSDRLSSDSPFEVEMSDDDMVMGEIS
jgi:acyl carrier protein